MSEEIRAMAAVMAGERPEESGLLTALCTAAEGRLRRRLREEAADYEEALACAAAFLAASWLLDSRCAGGEDVSFRAGSLSVTAPSAAARSTRSARLRMEAERMMAPYCADGGFDFRGVSG